jgi:hypothetical protein
MGTVSSVTETQLEVETTDGRKTAVLLTPETRYLKGKAAGSAADVQAGTRVVVTTVEEKGRVRATEVRIGVAKGAPSAKPAPSKTAAPKPPDA